MTPQQLLDTLQALRERLYGPRLTAWGHGLPDASCRRFLRLRLAIEESEQELLDVWFEEIEDDVTRHAAELAAAFEAVQSRIDALDDAPAMLDALTAAVAALEKTLNAD